MHFHLPRVQSFTHIVDQVRDVMKHYKHEKESEAHQVRGDEVIIISQNIYRYPRRFSVKLEDINLKDFHRQSIQ